MKKPRRRQLVFRTLRYAFAIRIDVNQQVERQTRLGLWQDVAGERVKGNGMKRVLIVFALAAVTMLAVFRFAGWYAENSALPRYCHDPRETISYVEKILTSNNPSGDQKRRPYIVAAKLIFLVPQQDEEPLHSYLDRLVDKITETCGTAF